VRGYVVHALWMDDLTRVWLDREEERRADRDPLLRRGGLLARALGREAPR